MDFGTLLHMAKKNSQDSKNDGKYYSTKFAPPKKEAKEKKLSQNIQKFLQKKEQEEKRKQQEQQEKLNQLLSMRDEKSKNKIRKMLKVTKSANRSVLEDAVNEEHTAVTMQGPEQPDQDDYGYVSTEANSFYQKYIDKVKDVKEDKGFAPSRPQSLKDLTGTKERVKAAITREIEEKNCHTRTRVSHVKESPSSSSSPVVGRTHTSSKPLYDPEAEKRQEEEERKKREAEKKKLKNRKPPPPIMDFQALLKLAEKKQHEPIDVPIEAKKKKEPERLMTMKEKQEMEERQRAKEARERRDRERNEELAKGKKPDKEKVSLMGPPTTQRMEPNGRIPKLNQSNNSSNNGSSKTSSSTSLSSSDKKSLSNSFDKKTSSSTSGNFSKPSTTSSVSSSNNRNSSSCSSQSPTVKSSNKLTSSSSSSKSSLSSANSSASSKTASSSSKQAYNGPIREFPPRDKNTVKSREFPPRDVQKTRQFPPPDVRRGAGPSSSKYGDSKKAGGSKRRILDDDGDSEYDSELDDFIDDGEEEEDYSSHIKAIFGYDKSRYRDEEFDDRDMESNFAQVQREEYISKKIGIKEDLEDMKQEAMEKKRKMMMKKQRLN